MEFADKRELARAAAEAQAWLDNDGPTMESEDIADLQAIGRALDAVRDADGQLREAVDNARAHGRTWARIGLALGTTRQAAQERFSRPSTAARRQSCQ